MCDTANTIWVCRYCDFRTRSEREAEAHDRKHRVYPVYLKSVSHNGAGPIGYCFRCGMPFYAKERWVMHELAMPKRPQGASFHETEYFGMKPRKPAVRRIQPKWVMPEMP